MRRRRRREEVEERRGEWAKGNKGGRRSKNRAEEGEMGKWEKRVGEVRRRETDEKEEE